jgi:hypothetical protein
MFISMIRSSESRGFTAVCMAQYPLARRYVIGVVAFS